MLCLGSYHGHPCVVLDTLETATWLLTLEASCGQGDTVATLAGKEAHDVLLVKENRFRRLVALAGDRSLSAKKPGGVYVR